jgi:hypothetical protein
MVLDRGRNAFECAGTVTVCRLFQAFFPAQVKMRFLHGNDFSGIKYTVLWR